MDEARARRPGPEPQQQLPQRPPPRELKPEPPPAARPVAQAPAPPPVQGPDLVGRAEAVSVIGLQAVSHLDAVGSRPPTVQPTASQDGGGAGRGVNQAQRSGGTTEANSGRVVTQGLLSILSF
jgi:hypothetical protein